MRSAGTTTSSQLYHGKKIVIRVITTIPCHERIHDKKKKRKRKKKMSFIVVPRRRENFSFPSFPSSTSFPYLVLDARSRRSIRISLQGSPSSFIQSNPSNGWTERRSRDFFFFFFFVIDTVLLVKIRCAYSNERGILRHKI